MKSTKNTKRNRLLKYLLWVFVTGAFMITFFYLLGIKKVVLPFVVAFVVSVVPAVFLIVFKNKEPTYGMFHYFFKNWKKRKDKCS